MEDNWKHRSKNMKCLTCMWFVEKVIDVDNDGGDECPVVKPIGRCRRHAPTINGFPVIFGNDWCGDHRLDENKIL